MPPLYRPPTPLSLSLPTTPTKRKRKRERERERERGIEMAQMITEEVRAKAEVYYGDSICREKTKLLLKEVGLPGGLLPLRDIIEVGYVEETGFVWLKQKKKIDHTFKKIGKLVSYGPEITAYVEKCKIKKLTGVKAKELLVWVTITDISVDDPPTGKLTFKISSGLFRAFPTSAFEPEDEKEADNDNVNNKKSMQQEETGEKTKAAAQA